MASSYSEEGQWQAGTNISPLAQKISYQKQPLHARFGMTLHTSSTFSIMTIRNTLEASNSFKAQAEALKSSHAQICSTDDVLLIRRNLT